MLIIQEIMLVWHKPERGGKPAEIRSRFDYVFPIEKMPANSDECLLETHRSYQLGTKLLSPEQYAEHMGWKNFKRYWEKLPPPTALAELKVKNLSFFTDGEDIRVDFFYDPERNGKPHRHGHNKDYNNEDSPLFGRDVLNETAFTLAPGQKGQIAYNARFVDWDNGTHWYEQTVVNIANIGFEEFRSNIFLSREFDFVYDRLERLY